MLQQAKELAIGVVILLAIIVITFLWTAYNNWNTVLVAILVFMVAYFWRFLISSITYEPATIKKISLAHLNCPQKVEKLLKMQTQEGDPINRVIVGLVDAERNLSQTEIRDKLADNEIKLSQPTINAYLDMLVGQGILDVDPREKKKGIKKTYWLTNQGKWFLRASDTFFPKTNLRFLLTHAIGKYTIELFPSPISEAEYRAR